MIEWKLEKRKISSLKPYSKNPRKLSDHDAQHLTTSIEKFGLADKPIITKEGLIIGGHQRHKILKKLGKKEVECWVPSQDLSEKDIEELNIRLNRNIGEWDQSILESEFEFSDLLEWGFKVDDFDSEPEGSNPEIEEDGQTLEPGKDEDAITKYGDLYQLNEHRLVCGDSTQPFYVDLCLNKETPILMVTDPPYGVNYEPEHRKKLDKFRSKSKTAYMDSDKIAEWSNAYKYFPGNIAYIWHATIKQMEVEQGLKNIGFEVKAQIIWKKQHYAYTRGFYKYQHEPCFYCIKNECKQNWHGQNNESTVWEIDSFNPIGRKDKESNDIRTIHAAQKPIECMARPIRNNSAPGEGVYDPFLGSGTTLIAAEQLGRKCYGIEISPAYCDIIVNRWKNYMIKNNKPYSIKRNGEVFGS